MSLSGTLRIGVDFQDYAAANVPAASSVEAGSIIRVHDTATPPSFTLQVSDGAAWHVIGPGAGGDVATHAALASGVHGAPGGDDLATVGNIATHAGLSRGVHLVEDAAPNNGDVLVWDTGTSQWRPTAMTPGLTFLQEFRGSVIGGALGDSLAIPAGAKWFSVALTLAVAGSGLPADLRVKIVKTAGPPPDTGPDWTGSFPLGQLVDIPLTCMNGAAPDHVTLASTGDGATALQYWVRFYE